jgi:transcriptional regulator with XRE-family HTH domain
MDENRLGALIAHRRKELGFSQLDLADRLHMKRETLSKIERGLLVYPLLPETTALVSSLLGIDQLFLVNAMGYRVQCPGLESEEEVALLDAYRRAPRDLQQGVRRLVGLPTPTILYPAPGSAEVRRIADRPLRRPEEE